MNKKESLKDFTNLSSTELKTISGGGKNWFLNIYEKLQFRNYGRIRIFK